MPNDQFHAISEDFVVVEDIALDLYGL